MFRNFMNAMNIADMHFTNYDLRDMTPAGAGSIAA